MEKSEKKRRGPAPKAPGEKAEQVSIRLPPKLKYGLELLSRAQRGRSLSQVVEWAVLRGLNAVEVGEGESLGSVLDLCWAEESEWRRLQVLHAMAPELLDFDERAIFDAVRNNKALNEFVDTYNSELYQVQKQNAPTPEAIEKARENLAHANEGVNMLVVNHWAEIKEAVARNDIDGKDLKTLPLSLLIPKFPRTALLDLASLGKYLWDEGMYADWIDPPF